MNRRREGHESSSMWTIALGAATVLTTAVWAQRGGGAGGHGGPPSLGAHGQSHADLDSKTVNSNVKLAEGQAKNDVQESNRAAESSST